MDENKTCPKCGGKDVSESWKIGQPDKFRCGDCGAKWIDGQRERAR